MEFKNIAKPEKLADYLYYLELDTYRYEPMPQKGEPNISGGCSSIRKGNLYGRNLDLVYCEAPEFIIRVNAGEGRYASVAICANQDAKKDISKITDDDLFCMPSSTCDGINENGVIVSVNVVNTTGIDNMKGTAPGKEKIHATRIVRFLLDRAKSAEHATEQMKEIDIVGGFMDYGLHWMIADEKDTYVVEIIGGKLVISKNEKFCMTNFYLNYGPVQPVQTIAETKFENLPLLNDYAIGLERWCILRDGCDNIFSEEDMAEMLKAVRYTITYNKEGNPSWYTECTGAKISIHSAKEDFEQSLAKQRKWFEARDRKNSQGDWITWHSSVYDIKNRQLSVYSQEDYTKKYTVPSLAF